MLECSEAAVNDGQRLQSDAGVSVIVSGSVSGSAIGSASTRVKRWTAVLECSEPSVNDGQRLESMALSSVAPPPIFSMELPFAPTVCCIHCKCFVCISSSEMKLVILHILYR